MLRRVYFVAVAFLLALVSFVVTASAGAALILAWGLLVGTLSVLFVKLIAHTGEPPNEIAAMLMAAAVVGAAGAFKWLTASPTVAWPDAVVGLVAMGAAWGLDLFLTTRGARQCFICKLPIADRIPFACPRCHQTICTRPSCWVARHFRCRYCDEREVIVFPIDEPWWRARFGPRVTHGACDSCYKEAHERDLRACGRCGHTMCRRCWDYHNGRCSHCEWIVPDPPAVLRPFLGAVSAPPPGRDDRNVRRQR